MTTERRKDAAPDQRDELDPETLAGIRSLLDEHGAPSAQTKRVKRLADTVEKPQIAEVEAEAAPSIPTPEEIAPSHSFEPLADAEEMQPAPKPKKAGKPRLPGSGRLGALKARVTGYRPTPRHVVWAGLGLLVLFRPWLVVGLVFLTLFLFLGLFLILGYDGFWRRAMALGHWYARRRPAKAALLHQKLDRFAMKWDAILDHFPEGTVDGLYLPDFSELAEADARHDAALDRRLESLRESQS